MPKARTSTKDGTNKSKTNIFEISHTTRLVNNYCICNDGGTMFINSKILPQLMSEDENKSLTVKQFNEFIKYLVEYLNQVHDQTCKRLDAIKQRFESIENSIHSVMRDITIIPSIFEIPHTDG